MSQQLRLGIPAGSLQEATAELFRNAGFKITFASRSYYPAIDDPDDGSLRSGICAGLGAIRLDTLSYIDIDSVRPTLVKWYQSASDSGTHGASRATNTTAPPA